MLSVLIPSRSEPYLGQTVADLLAKAVTPIEILVLIDGGDPPAPLPADPRVKVLVHPEARGTRVCHNELAAEARGDVLVKFDAHCCVSPGFDRVIQETMTPGTVLTLRRFFLDPEPWTIRELSPVDREYLAYPLQPGRAVGALHPKPHRRLVETVTDTMGMNGACWAVTKQDLRAWGGFDTRFWSFHIDAVELTLKAWLSGGRLQVTPHAWHGHWWKRPEHRTVPLDWTAMRNTQAYSTWYWTHDRWPLATRPFSWLVERFWPVPGWPETWHADLAALPEPTLTAFAP